MPRLLIAAATLLCVAGPASAVQIVFAGNDDASLTTGTSPNADAARAQFLAALPRSGSNGFESFADGATPPLALSFGTTGITGTLTGGTRVISNTRADPTAVGNYAIEGARSYFAETDATLVGIGFSAPLIGFGLYIVDIEGPDSARVTISRASGDTTVVLSTLTGLASGSNGTVSYLGLLDTADPLTGFTLTGNIGDSFNIDLLTVGLGAAAVPAPTLPLGLAFAALVAARARRAKR